MSFCVDKVKLSMLYWCHKVERGESMNKIAGYRKMLGKTQTEMGKEFGISKQAYYKKEKRVVPFSDNEKLIFKKMLTPLFSNITIDDIFFS